MSLRLDPSSVVDKSPHWTIAVNRNQNLLGNVILVATRPVESVVDLEPTEWSDLHHVMRRVCDALDELFRPDLFNHAFLMNIDAQVHLHVIPRYRARGSGRASRSSTLISEVSSAPNSGFSAPTDKRDSPD